MNLELIIGGRGGSVITFLLATSFITLFYILLDISLINIYLMVLAIIIFDLVEFAQRIPKKARNG